MSKRDRRVFADGEHISHGISLMAQASEAIEELVAAIDAFEITGDPPRVSEQMRDHLMAAIEEVYGPDANPEVELRELLAFLVLTANLLRKP